MLKPLIVRTLLVVLFYLLTGCATSPPVKPDDVCSIFREKSRWHKIASRAEKKWHTSMHIPMAIMYQESSFKPNARPPRRTLLGFIPWRRPSSALGYAQVLDGTWRSYMQATGEYGRERTDFADATDFIHWYINQAVKRNGVAKTDTYSLYLNYHEGPTGYARKTYNKKKWLKRTALKVQQRAERYTAQYSRCKDKLPKPGFFSRLFGR